MDVLTHRFPQNPLLVAVQVYEHTERTSLAELRERLDSSSVRMYDLNAAGQNHGTVLSARSGS